MCEKGTGDQWATYHLSEETVQSIRQIEGGLDENIPGELGAILKQLKVSNDDCVGYSDYSRLGEWQDFHFREVGPGDNSVPGVCDQKQTSHCARSKQELDDFSSALLRVIHRKADVTSAMQITSALNEGDLRIITKKVWLKLRDNAEKSIFISHLSSSFESSKVLCEEIIYAMFLDEESVKSFFELLQPQIVFLDSSIVSGVVLPLLQVSDSILIKDLRFFDDLFTSLSDSQKLIALRLFCDSAQELQQWQLPILEKIVEKVTLTTDSVPILSEFLGDNIDAFAKDRYMGSILLHLLSQLSKASLKDVVHCTTPLFSRYSGVLKVRIRNELEKLS